MWRLFAPLYILMLGLMICADQLSDQYTIYFHHDKLVQDRTRDVQGLLQAIDHFSEGASAKELRDVFERTNADSNMPVEVFSRLALSERYPQATARFDEKNIYFLDVDAFEFLYRLDGGDAVLKIGPIETTSELAELENSLKHISWLALIVLVSAWQFNVWRKLVKLERSVVRFGEGDLTERASLAPSLRVGKLNTTFNYMADKIGQAISQNKQVMRAVSHELRAPIARLRCLVDLHDPKTSSAQDSHFIDNVSEDIDELQGLVEEILYYLRLDTPGTIPCKFDVLNIQPVLLDIVGELREELSREIPLTCPVNLRVKIDNGYFGRAIRNLVRNAVLHGGDTMSVSVNADRHHNMLFINVDDNGPGIPTSERNRIFEPFARLDESRTKISGGYGLGLAIVQQVASLHAGTATASSSPAGGARFTLAMPVLVDGTDSPSSI